MASGLVGKLSYSNIESKIYNAESKDGNIHETFKANYMNREVTILKIKSKSKSRFDAIMAKFASLRHENLCTILENFTDTNGNITCTFDEDLYNLEDFIKDYVLLNNCPYESLLRIAKQMFDFINYLHDQNITLDFFDGASWFINVKTLHIKFCPYWKLMNSHESYYSFYRKMDDIICAALILNRILTKAKIPKDPRPSLVESDPYCFSKIMLYEYLKQVLVSDDHCDSEVLKNWEFPSIIYWNNKTAMDFIMAVNDLRMSQKINLPWGNWTLLMKPELSEELLFSGKKQKYVHGNQYVTNNLKGFVKFVRDVYTHVGNIVKAERKATALFKDKISCINFFCFNYADEIKLVFDHLKGMRTDYFLKLYYDC